jgi:hypothetical protein
MGEIVNLPRPKRARSKPNAWQVERVQETVTPNAQTFDFTCATCKNKSSLALSNAVLKNMEIYCDRCGTGWRVTNPIFATKRDTGI